MNRIEAIEQLAEIDRMLRILNKAEKGLWVNAIRAIGEAARAIKREDADGCTGCKFTDVETWDLPCRECKRNSKDYWREKE